MGVATAFFLGGSDGLLGFAAPAESDSSSDTTTRLRLAVGLGVGRGWVSSSLSSTITLSDLLMRVGYDLSGNTVDGESIRRTACIGADLVFSVC